MRCGSSRPRLHHAAYKGTEGGNGLGKKRNYHHVEPIEAKGAVIHVGWRTCEAVLSAVDREDTVLEETKGFRERVYEGSVTMMVDAIGEFRFPLEVGY